MQFYRLGLTNADDAQNTPNSTCLAVTSTSAGRHEVGYSFKYCRPFRVTTSLWSPFKYWDPEIWWNSYPLQRTFNFGVQVKI